MKDRPKTHQLVGICGLVIVAFLLSFILFMKTSLDSATVYAEGLSQYYLSDLASQLHDNPSPNSYDDVIAAGDKAHGQQGAIATGNGTIVSCPASPDYVGMPLFGEDGVLDKEQASIASQNHTEGSAWTGIGLFRASNPRHYAWRFLDDLGIYVVVRNAPHETFQEMRQELASLAVVLVVIMVAIIASVVSLIKGYRDQIVRMATIDELTGLRNRRSFMSDYDRLLRQHGDGTLHLFLLDIDFFKRINDTYGHAAGDDALSSVANQIKSFVGDEGIAGRWGGDEFIGVISCDEADVAARVAQLVDHVGTIVIDDTFSVTISLGIAEVDEAISLNHMVERADMALYESKRGGRNKASVYQPGRTLEVAYEADEQVRIKASETGGSGATERSATDTDTGHETGRRAALVRVGTTTIVKAFSQAIQGMIPFVVSGGILIAIAYLVDSATIGVADLTDAQRTAFGSISPLAGQLRTLGLSVFNFMLPIFGAYFARGVGGIAAFPSGFAGGYLASQGTSGFAGTILAGLVAGLVARILARATDEVSVSLRSIFTMLVSPVISMLLTYLVLQYLVEPIGAATLGALEGWLTLLAQTHPIAFGGIAGAMMATDMGGPINKAAYHVGVASIASGNPHQMAVALVAGMVPPCGVALSTLLFRQRFSKEEREQAPSTLVMGLSFVTEGVFPYLKNDLARVIPSCMAGSCVAGLVSEICGVTMLAPHGGIVVFLVANKPAALFAALVAGSLVTAGLLGILRGQDERDAQEETDS